MTDHVQLHMFKGVGLLIAFAAVVGAVFGASLFGDAQSSRASEPPFSFSPATVAVSVEVGETPVYAAPTLVGVPRNSNNTTECAVTLYPLQAHDQHAGALNVQPTPDFGLSYNGLAVTKLSNNGQWPLIGRAASVPAANPVTYTINVRCVYSKGAKPTLSASHKVTVTFLPTSLKFNPNSLGHRSLIKDIPLGSASSINPQINRPTMYGADGAVGYSVSPALPAGLSLSTDGSIVGTPTAASARQTYTITATDSETPPESATYTVDISVIDAMVFGANSLPSQTLTVGQASVSYNPPTLHNADGAVRYTVSPALPSGLTLGSTSGVLSGSPTAAASRRTYTITATDARQPTAQTASFTIDLTVRPKPQVTWTLASQSVAESIGARNLRLTISPAPTSTVSVGYALSGTATRGADYSIAGVTSNNGTVSVASGMTVVDIPVTITDDANNEPNETLTLTLSDGAGYGVGGTRAHTLTIRDNDVPVLTIAGGADITEGAAASFTLTASPTPHSPLTASLTVSASGSYGVSTGTRTVTVGTNGQGALSLTTTGDSTDEPNGSVTATLTSRSGYTIGNPSAATVNIADNDNPPPTNTPIVSFASASQTAAEDAGSVQVALSISPAPTSAISVSYRLSGSAAATPDYAISNSGTVAVASGATSVNIAVQIVNDNVHESTESLVFTLTGGSGYSLGGTGVHTLTITDNDLGLDVNNFPQQVAFQQGQTATHNLGSYSGGTTGIQCRQTGGTLPAGINLRCTQPSLYGTPSQADRQTVQVEISRNGVIVQKSLEVIVRATIAPTIAPTVQTNVGGTPSPQNPPRAAIVASDPAFFCRGVVSDVAEPAPQPFPTLGREAPSQRPCAGTGLLTLNDLSATLTDEQMALSRGFYITTQLHSVADKRPRFRSGRDGERYILDHASGRRYDVSSSQPLIEISLWMLRYQPLLDANTVWRLGRDEAISEEFRICLPQPSNVGDSLTDIARWNPDSLTWTVLHLTMPESAQQVCALTDQISSFVIVTSEPPPAPEVLPGVPQPGDPT